MVYWYWYWGQACVVALLGSPDLTGPGAGWRGEAPRISVVGMTSAGEQALEIVHADAGVPKDGPERATVELAVIGHDHLGERVRAAHHDVAAMLANEPKADLSQGVAALTTGNPGEARHTATRRVLGSYIGVRLALLRY